MRCSACRHEGVRHRGRIALHETRAACKRRLTSPCARRRQARTTRRARPPVPPRTEEPAGANRHQRRDHLHRTTALLDRPTTETTASCLPAKRRGFRGASGRFRCRVSPPCRATERSSSERKGARPARRRGAAERPGLVARRLRPDDGFANNRTRFKNNPPPHPSSRATPGKRAAAGVMPAPHYRPARRVAGKLPPTPTSPADWTPTDRLETSPKPSSLKDFPKLWEAPSRKIHGCGNSIPSACSYRDGPPFGPPGREDGEKTERARRREKRGGSSFC